MATQWFYQTSEGQLSGPVDSTQLRRLAEAGVIRPDTLVRKGDSARWVRAEQVRGLFQPSTPAPSSTPATLPLPTPVPQSGALVNEESEKPERVWPVTWAAIIVGSGSVLLLLWALVFRGGGEPQQQAEKDHPPLAAEPSAESRASADPWDEYLSAAGVTLDEPIAEERAARSAADWGAEPKLFDADFAERVENRLAEDAAESASWWYSRPPARHQTPYCPTAR